MLLWDYIYMNAFGRYFDPMKLTMYMYFISMRVPQFHDIFHTIDHCKTQKLRKALSNFI